jgi:hypothetical protein
MKGCVKEKVIKNCLGLKKDESPQNERAHGMHNKINIRKPTSTHMMGKFKNTKKEAKF